MVVIRRLANMKYKIFVLQEKKTMHKWEGSEEIFLNKSKKKGTDEV